MDFADYRGKGGRFSTVGQINALLSRLLKRWGEKEKNRYVIANG